MRRFCSCLFGILSIGVLVGAGSDLSAAEPPLKLKKGDNVVFIGNTTADRMQHHGWLETYIHALHPEHDLVFRNLGFPGDELKTRMRSANFGTPDQWLTKTEADVIFSFFGYNEALKGDTALEGFKSDLAETIDGMRAQKYNGRSAPQLVFFSPIAHENLYSPHLPDGAENNKKLEMYTAAMRDVCRQKEVTFVDLFTPTQALYVDAKKPLTMNGIHLLPNGDREVARVIVQELFQNGGNVLSTDVALKSLREAVLDKNYHWFSRYRVVDGYNVFGGRSKLAWFGQSNADVMMREMEIFDVMTVNRDKRVWAVARGGDLKVTDDNIPDELVVNSNKKGDLNDGSFSYLDGKAAMEKMKLGTGLEVNLFASEDMFPELVNPVQMAVDTDSRLFVSVWPSYPHWNPTQPRTDRILCLPDENHDGVADKCVIFADKLNSITGFEFWGGGMLVAAPPEIWFLKDTDGDDKADLKVRMLQGVSSADSHHSANAVVIGPDGWMYWSRGIFNVAMMETPTKTYRSAKSGVHRFNPRSFEMEFHFPIGPNPHGDVFDQWGFQFANDGTGGTGSYVNIGKGIGNKQWFKKRVRPVAATGILSSSHFPEANNGNFLICNCIGFLGVLQHEVKYNGADITAEEIEPILVSSDPNFRPTDLEVGGDGALYVSDWANALIGHMQHNIRDPNRDHQHGRIYRVTAKGRKLLTPVKLKGKPISEVLQAFYAKENGTRYRARLELSGRDTSDVISAVNEFVSKLDPAKPADAQALLECIWVHSEHGVPSVELVAQTFQADEPRVRAAAVRSLGNWGPELQDWEDTLIAAARDDSPLVRAEAAKAAVEFAGVTAAEVIFEVATRDTDPELETVLKYSRSNIDVDKLVKDAIDSGRKLSPAAMKFALANADVSDLLKMEKSEAVYEAILNRQNVPTEPLRVALEGLSTLRKSNKLELLVDLIKSRDDNGQTNSLASLQQLLSEQSASDLSSVKNQIEKLAAKGKDSQTRKMAYAAWINADRSGDEAFVAAAKNKGSLRDLLEAIPSIQDSELKAGLYENVRSLMFELPSTLKAESGGLGSRQSGIQVEYFYPSGSNVANETLDKMKPQAVGVVPEIVMNVPQRKQADKFALRFTGYINVPRSGNYTFYVASDDGSRIYVDGQLLVNNDGLHGMVERKGSVNLTAGAHPLTVTYFDNGGGDGLSVAWSGPRLRKQAIHESALTLAASETLHDVAIRTMQSIPGHDKEKFLELARLIRRGRNRASAISALKSVPEDSWAQERVGDLVDNLVGYLSEIPAQSRTSGPALDAMAVATTLAKRLPAADANAVVERLKNLDVRVIAIGTVPHRMIYDKERIAVQAGKPVEFRFSNSDNMPHNFAIALPGSLEEIGLLAESTARDADAMQRQYIPKSDKILAASRLLQPGQNQALTFEAPKEPGVYPYVCTYPGHWRRMYGALYVVENLDEYLVNPESYLANHPMPLKDELLKFTSRNTEWKYDDLIASVSPLPHGRNFEVGLNLFKVANCVGCHKMNGEGRELGPDLTKIESKKHTTEHILRSLLEPSKEIAEKYQSNTFVMDSGKVMTGMIVEENNDTVKLLIDPLAKAAPIVVNKSEIDDRAKSPTSIMPMGLLNKLTQEEILDLIAYIYAKGDQKHMLFKSDHHNH